MAAGPVKRAVSPALSERVLSRSITGPVPSPVRFCDSYVRWAAGTCITAPRWAAPRTPMKYQSFINGSTVATVPPINSAAITKVADPRPPSTTSATVRPIRKIDRPIASGTAARFS